MIEWSGLRQRHRDFWSRGAAATPISGNKRTTAFVLGDYEFAETGRPLQPDDIEIPRLLDWAEALYRRGDSFLDGELVWGLPPLPGVPWMEAILGCPIWSSKVSRSLWAEPWLDDWEAIGIERVLPLSSNPWYRKLLELTSALVKHANGRFPVTQTLMRGPADLAVAIRGHERFCLDMYDQPEAARRLAEFCADVWIEVAQAQFALLPAFAGGYTAPRLEVWAPGRLIRIEEDATILFSPLLYKRIFQDADRRIVSQFEYSMIHTHSDNHKLIPSLLEMKELTAIQVLLDPTGPPVEKMLPILKTVQDAGKALLITHELDEAAVQRIVNALSPRGLALERMISV